MKRVMLDGCCYLGDSDFYEYVCTIEEEMTIGEAVKFLVKMFRHVTVIDLCCNELAHYEDGKLVKGALPEDMANKKVPNMEIMESGGHIEVAFPPPFNGRSIVRPRNDY